MKTIIPKLILTLLFASLAVSSNAAKTVKVFLLAGQSNMEGQGVVDMDHPKYYNGGKGTLLRVMKNSTDSKRYAHLKDKKGEWVARDDAFIRFRNKQGVMAGACIWVWTKPSRTVFLPWPAGRDWGFGVWLRSN